jgi:type I restriction enzyme S subunit
MAVNKVKLGELLKLSSASNEALEYGLESVMGISIKKEFIDTKADMAGVPLDRYLLVEPEYFAYVPVTSRNGGKIYIAYNTSDKTSLVSSTYIVFYIERNELILPDYLNIFINRPELDRYARFHSWGSAREVFSWDDMCDIEIELPSMPIQQKYAVAYCALANNANLKTRLKNVCPVLIKGALEEAVLWK